MWLLWLGAALTGSIKEPKAQWRFETEHGPVHVFRPAGYERSKGGVVVYVHGLYNDVDSAWESHALPDQFQETNRNAIFIAPEAPVQGSDPVRWTDLQSLLDAVHAQRPDLLLDEGRLVAMGHSGAYRTIATWLKHPRLSEVILVDGLYGLIDEYTEWLKADADHRMMLTVLTTTKWATPFVARFPSSVRLAYIPKWTWPDAAKEAQLVHIWSHKFGHMEQVTDKQTIPVLMRLTRLSRRWEPQ
jgi:hypothetical protein